MQSIKEFQDIKFEDLSVKRCGCYVKNKKIAFPSYENKHILVPLREISYEAEIVNSIVNVTLVQEYFNPTDKILEMEYSFPISPKACVYKFVASFENNRIEGVVKEKEEAKKEYQKAISEGKQAAYGEINKQSKDIMNLTVGNVTPACCVKIEISYLQELKLSYNMFYQLHMMGTISPRYMNYVPKEVLQGGFRKKGKPTGQKVLGKGEFYWDFKIILKTTRKVTFFDSQTHDITLQSQNDSATESVINFTDKCLPNKDFIFSYTTENYELPSYVFGRTDSSCTAMLSFIPKFCQLNINDAYRASVLGKPYEAEIEKAKGEYIFLLDRSGSMGGTRIKKAVEALVLFIQSLPPDTYFNVISFGNGFNNLFNSSKKYSDAAIDDAVKKIKKMGADMGGTQIYTPLHTLLSSKTIEGYPKQIFLLTDGGVGNTEGVIKMVANNTKYARVHSIGIGNGASQALILGCAEKGKGSHVFIQDNEDPSEKIIQLLTESLSPVVTQMKLKYDKELVQSIIPNPESMPYILKGEMVNFYITFKIQLEKSTSFTFEYIDSQNKNPFKSDIEIDPQSNSEPFIDKMAHFKKIKILQDSFHNDSKIEDYIYYVKNVDKKKEIIDQSVKHQILSEFTAFICVEKELVDGKFQEIMGKEKIHVQIENPKPLQYQMEKCSMPMASSNSFMSRPSKRSAPILYGAPLIKSNAMKLQSCKMMKSSAPSKKKSSEGFFSKITNFFAGGNKCMKQQNCIQSLEYDQKAVFDQCDDELEEEQIQNFSSKMDDKRDKKKKQINIQPIQQRQAEKKQIKTITKTSLQIKELISHQASEGSFKDIKLIEILYSKQLMEIVEKEKMSCLITYLVAKWIEKNYPQKQYSLVVKKALSWAKKESQNFEELEKRFAQYL